MGDGTSRGSGSSGGPLDAPSNERVTREAAEITPRLYTEADAGLQKLPPELRPVTKRMRDAAGQLLSPDFGGNPDAMGIVGMA